jgi:hypothetical protein
MHCKRDVGERAHIAVKLQPLTLSESLRFKPPPPFTDTHNKAMEGFLFCGMERERYSSILCIEVSVPLVT